MVELFRNLSPLCLSCLFYFSNVISMNWTFWMMTFCVAFYPSLEKLMILYDLILIFFVKMTFSSLNLIRTVRAAEEERAIESSSTCLDWSSNHWIAYAETDFGGGGLELKLRVDHHRYDSILVLPMGDQLQRGVFFLVIELVPLFKHSYLLYQMSVYVYQLFDYQSLLIFGLGLHIFDSMILLCHQLIFHLLSIKLHLQQFFHLM